MRVTVVDSGMGNLHSVVKALKHVGADVDVATDATDIDLRIISAQGKLVLPGVGAFAENVKALVARGLWRPVASWLASDRPFLGICVGMQLLMDGSEEFGWHEGFGIIPGKVKALQGGKVPHVGWAPLLPCGGPEDWNGTALDGVRPGALVYFTHSYAAHPVQHADVLTETPWGHSPHLQVEMVSAVRRGNVMGVQFHPEKSGEVGLAILRRWVNQ